MDLRKRSAGGLDQPRRHPVRRAGARRHRHQHRHGDKQSSEVVVTGIKESLQRAIEIKRTSRDQVDAVSASDIGKLPDKNVADALQRIPGVNTESAASGEGGFDENDRVSIRGTSPSLTQVTVDGHAIATGDWFILDQFQTVGRSVSFTLLPAEIVQSTVVYKTQDASLLEGGVAGVVDLRHATRARPRQRRARSSSPGRGRRRLQQPDRQLEAAGQRHRSPGPTPTAPSASPCRASTRTAASERYGQETLGYTAITAAMPIGAANPELIGVQAPTLIGSTLFQQEKNRDGGHFDVDWRPNDRVELNLDGFYSKLERQQRQRQLHVLGLERAQPQPADQLHGRQQHPDLGHLAADRADHCVHADSRRRRLRRSADRRHRSSTTSSAPAPAPTPPTSTSTASSKSPTT